MADSPHGGESSSSSREGLGPGKVTLDDLVGTFVAAKRSLSSIDLVARAREIVESGRGMLEENAILSAGNSFARQAVDQQLDSLAAIKQAGHAVDMEGYQELKVCLIAVFVGIVADF
jgi:autophagy-related protein 17